MLPLLSFSFRLGRLDGVREQFRESVHVCLKVGANNIGNTKLKVRQSFISDDSSVHVYASMGYMNCILNYSLGGD